MKAHRIALLIAVVAAPGCRSFFYGPEGNSRRLEAWGGALLRRDPRRYGDYVINRYTRFLHCLPEGSSVDGARERIMRNRAQAYRVIGMEDAARKDEEAATAIRTHSPYFLARELERRPDLSPANERATSRRFSRGEQGMRLGACTIEGEMDSESRSDRFRSMGSLRACLKLSRFAFCPAISSRFTLYRRRVAISLIGNLEGACFKGETQVTESFSYDGRDYTVGDRLKSRITLVTTTLGVGLTPNLRLEDRLEILMGLRYVFMETRFHSPASGTHIVVYHVPFLTPGIRFEIPLAPTFMAGGMVRFGFMAWYRGAGVYGMYDVMLDCRAHVRVQVSEMMWISAGAGWEALRYVARKSGSRQKDFTLQSASAFAEIRFLF